MKIQGLIDMKKVLTIILLILLITACSSSNNSDSKEEPAPDPEEQQAIEKKEIEVWDIESALEFDEIENWFTTRSGYYGSYMAEGASGDYTKASDFYSVSYNRDDFYNSDGSDLFVIGSFEKGGLMVKKDGKWGLINSKGEMKTDCTHQFYTHVFNGVTFRDGKINHDYTIDPFDDFPGGAGSGTGLSLLLIDVNGNVYTGEDESAPYPWPGIFKSVDLFEDAKKNGYVDEDGFIVLNSYAGMIDHDNYFPEVKIPSNCIEAYTIIDKNGFKFLDVPDNYVINDISDEIISFAECTSDPRSTKPTTDNDGYVVGNAYAMKYYDYEIFCDDYGYRNFSFVDREGNIIARGFDDAYGFYDGYAAVKKNGKWGFIDKQGNLVVDYIFDKATALSEGKSWVIYNGKTGRLNLVEQLENGITVNSDTLSSETITIE